MKKIVFASLLIIVSSTALFAQQALKQALDKFHYSLAFTYHPMADDSNFTPIRNRSAQLASSAGEVKRVSDSLNTKNTSLSTEINELAKQCQALESFIQKGAPDDAIRIQLTAIHSRFHEIDKMVSGGKEE